MDGSVPNTDRLETLALDLIDESLTNPRKHFDAAKLAELADDLKANGLTQPVVVRSRDGGRYELVVGARRTRASKMAGFVTILAIVREHTDREVLEIQLSENAQRQDVHPLEEADGFAALMEVHKASIEEVAATVAKPVGYVRHRLQYRALCPEGREAFFAGTLTPHTALLVARIPAPSLQVEAVTGIVRGDYQSGNEPFSAKRAGEYIRGRFMLRLADAPFDRGDATLVEAAGPCTTCPKRTGNQAELFADVESPDTCIDPDCYSEKKDADWKRRAEAAKAKGHKVLADKAAKEVFGYGGRLAYQSEYVDLAEKPYEIEQGKKSYKSLIGKDNLPSVTVARDETGKVHELVKKDDLKVALKAAGVTKTTATPSNNSQAIEREKKLQRVMVAERVIAALVPAVEAHKPDAALWRFFAWVQTRQGYDSVAKVEKRRGLADKKSATGTKLEKSLQTMPEPAPTMRAARRRRCSGSRSCHCASSALRFCARVSHSVFICAQTKANSVPATVSPFGCGTPTF